MVSQLDELYVSSFDKYGYVTAKDLFSILNLNNKRPGDGPETLGNFTAGEIRRAYRKRTLRLHPDAQGRYETPIPPELCQRLLADVKRARDCLLESKLKIAGTALVKEIAELKAKRWHNVLRMQLRQLVAWIRIWLHSKRGDAETTHLLSLAELDELEQQDASVVDGILHAAEYSTEAEQNQQRSDLVDNGNACCGFWGYIPSLPQNIIGTFLSTLVLSSMEVLNLTSYLCDQIFEKMGWQTSSILFWGVKKLAVLLTFLTYVPLHLALQVCLQASWISWKASFHLYTNLLFFAYAAYKLFRHIFCIRACDWRTESFNMLEAVSNIFVKVTLTVPLEVLDATLYFLLGKSYISAFIKALHQYHQQLVSYLKPTPRLPVSSNSHTSPEIFSDYDPKQLHQNTASELLVDDNEIWLPLEIEPDRLPGWQSFTEEQQALLNESDPWLSDILQSLTEHQPDVAVEELGCAPNHHFQRQI